MIPRAYRLTINSASPLRGHRLNFSWGNLVFAPSVSPQWAVTVSKKAVPLATRRNRLRRQIAHHYYAHLDQLSPHLAFRIIISKSPAKSKEIIQQTCSHLYTDS